MNIYWKFKEIKKSSMKILTISTNFVTFKHRNNGLYQTLFTLTTLVGIIDRERWLYMTLTDPVRGMSVDNWIRQSVMWHVKVWSNNTDVSANNKLTLQQINLFIYFNIFIQDNKFSKAVFQLGPVKKTGGTTDCQITRFNLTFQWS